MAEIEVRAAGVVLGPLGVLLVSHVKRGESYWVLPGGHVKKGETLAEALRRELDEELALAAEPAELLWAWDFISEKPGRHVVNFAFLAHADVPGSPRVAGSEDGKIADARFFNTDALADIDLRPDLRPLLIELLEGRPPTLRYLGRI